MIQPLDKFPLMSKYKKVFPNIDKNTVIAYDGKIYCNNKLPDHLIIHETQHLKQQEKIGLYEWVERYLNDVDFRLRMEIDAYKTQIYSIKDREARNKVRLQSANALSSPLYNSLININEAMKLLK